MKQHTGESLFTCPFCSKKYNEKIPFTHHLGKVHDKEYKIEYKNPKQEMQTIVEDSSTYLCDFLDVVLTFTSLNNKVWTIRLPSTFQHTKNEHSPQALLEHLKIFQVCDAPSLFIFHLYSFQEARMESKVDEEEFKCASCKDCWKTRGVQRSTQ